MPSETSVPSASVGVWGTPADVLADVCRPSAGGSWPTPPLERIEGSPVVAPVPTPVADAPAPDARTVAVAPAPEAGTVAVARGVTVVLATRNRREQAVRAVRRLRELPERPGVILVDDGSTDGTAAAVRTAFPDVAVLQPAGPRGVTAARNAGVRAAVTPFVAFCDDDSGWAPGALGTAARQLDAHPRLALVAARILVGEQERLDPTCIAMAASPLRSGGLPGRRVLGFVACGAVVRRDAFLAVGGFAERYVIGGEEQPLALVLAAAGWDLAYLDGVVAHHFPNAVPDDRGRRGATMARNDLWTAWRHRRGLGALVETVGVVRRAARARELAGVGQALLGLPWALRRRSPVTASVEAERRMLDRATPLRTRATAPPAVPRTAAARRRWARIDCAVVAHHRPPPRATAEDRLAVVVVTHDRVDELVDSLGRLRDLPERPHVVVVDNASTDGTAAAVRAAHPWVQLLVLDRNAGAVGRNVAVDLLGHPYVAFADDDTWWERGSLRRAADALDEHPTVAVVTARIVVEPAGVEDPVVADLRDSPLTDDPRLPGRPLLSVLAGASVVRRSAFLQVGGFEPRLRIGGEEELLSADLVAAGWHLRYLPELTVHHAPSRARDPHRRRADGLRNTLWCTWLRRPLPRAAWRSCALLRQVPRDGVSARAVAEALAGLPWVLRDRQVLPAAVEAELRLLDHQQLHSRARRYVS